MKNKKNEKRNKKKHITPNPRRDTEKSKVNSDEYKYQ